MGYTEMVAQATFLSTDLEGMLFTKYQQCYKGTRTTSEYAHDFHQLSSCNNLSETKEQLMAWFVGGLKSKLQEKLTLQPQHSLMEMIKVVKQL